MKRIDISSQHVKQNERIHVSLESILSGKYKRSDVAVNKVRDSQV
jgi:hypothetical protein